MKVKLSILLLFGISGIVKSANAQLVNNGATITIQNGAYIMAMGDVRNTSGTITNDGRIEVQGNFINTGTYTSTSNEDSLIMTGIGVDTLAGGGATINYLTINKTAATDIVRLGGTTIVNTKLDYLSGLLTTDPLLNPSFTITSPVAAVYNFAAGREIIGSVRRTSWTNSAAHIFNQPNMIVTTNNAGGTVPTDITVTMIPQSAGGDPTDNEREVKRKFQFAQTGGSGFTADVRFPYVDVPSELSTNTENNLVSWGRFSGEWNGKLTTSTRNTGADWVATTAIPQTELINEWKLADPKYTFNVTANLRGPWNGTAMNTSLNSAGIIQLTQPYNTTPFNYFGSENVGSIPNVNVVDWVLVEHRKPITGLPADAASATITGRKAGFLLSNGLVTEVDGFTPINFDIAKQGTSFITVRHRNHLGVLSIAIPSNAAGTFTNDYTVLTNAYVAPGSPSGAMTLLAGAGGKYGLWAGDANKSGNLAASDITAIKSAVASSASGYILTDVNLSANIAATDVTLAKLMISNSGTGSTPSRIASPKTNIPDGVVVNQ